MNKCKFAVKSITFKPKLQSVVFKLKPSECKYSKRNVMTVLNIISNTVTYSYTYTVYGTK